MKKCMIIELAACAVVIAGVILPLCAEEVAPVVRGTPPAAAQSSGGQTTIMTWNICHCAANFHDNSTIDPARTAEVIKKVAPDFACLQEVDRKVKRSGRTDQTARLAELTGMHGVFAKAINLTGGEYGVAILSKEEAVATNRVALAGAEKRVMLVCEFADMFVATTHLDNNAAKRRESIATMTNELAKCAAKKPVFFTGDLNATPQSEDIAALKRFAEVLTPENGIATLNSRRRKGDYVIDYIMMDRAHRDAFRVDGAWLVEERKASDHAPLVVKIAPARTKRKPSGGGD